MTDHRTSIASNLQAFAPTPLRQASLDLLATLGYQSDKTIDLEGSKPQAFLDFIKEASPAATFDQKKALFDEWQSADLLFQLTDKEISGEHSLFKDTKVKRGLLRSYLFFAIELTGDDDYARGKLTDIARQINRVFPMPVMVLIKHLADKKPVLSIAVINRRRNKKQADKDVLEKTTIIRDISLTEPHRGHLDILNDLVFVNLSRPEKKPITDFDALHTAWEQIFNVELLNNRFYKELSNWYFWALRQVEFPADLERDDEKRRATGLIRLLTRLVFCWFLKEKGLIPDKLFHTTELAQILKGFDSKSEDDSNYYQAILQNLFFATLNQRMGKPSTKNARPYRRFISSQVYQGKNKEHGILNLFRYPELFADPATALDHFADTPFLNGGLFECLDREDPDDKNRLRHIDGFTSKEAKRPKVPNYLFFSNKTTADLSKAYGDNKRKKEPVTGLINILNGYKFTIVENTPIDQEIALDPELLGKVFENLLASYNEETKATARKQTGSFYTPRPIVDYMVDESLKAHLTRALVETANMPEDDAQTGLDILFAYIEQEHAFESAEVDVLIAAIDKVKILDPACGSGAFPMGVLHKLVYILGKLDPDNERWKQTQLDKLDSTPMREELERAFVDNDDDYGRKLYLIQNCLYGVDIQPIAIQISKLRFFISLICDQQTNNEKKNRGIRPLPNLETKFIAANSLIGLQGMGSGLAGMSQMEFESDPHIGVIHKKIETLYHKHFSIQHRDQKLVVQRKVKILRREMADLLAQSRMSEKQSECIAEWDAFDPQSTANWFDPQWMFGVNEGFDIVIGNPPYVFARNSAAKGITQAAKDYYYANYSLAEYQVNLYPIFIEAGSRVLTKQGVLCFITPNNWLTINTNRKLRQFVLAQSKVSILNFYARVFESADVDAAIVLFQAGNADSKTESVRLLEWTTEPELIVDAPKVQFLSQADAIINIQALKSGETGDLMTKIEKGTRPLKEIASVKSGLKAYEVGKGTPPQTKEMKDARIYHTTVPKTGFSKYLGGRDVCRYAISWSGKYIKYGKNLAAPRNNFDLYSTPRILVRQIPNKPPYCIHASLISETVFNDLNSMNIINITIKPQLVLAVLNSRLVSYWFIHKFGKMQRGIFPQFKINELAIFPIPRSFAPHEKSLITSVDGILTAKANHPAADTSTLEHEIDQHVYQLYQLTPDEIKTIEST